jgi:hypothetical protein
VGIAGDSDVCKNKINRVVPVIITADFQAEKDISSDFVVSNDVDIRGKLNGWILILWILYYPTIISIEL